MPETQKEDRGLKFHSCGLTFGVYQNLEGSKGFESQFILVRPIMNSVPESHRSPEGLGFRVYAFFLNMRCSL
jgi:hypothetical protein